MEFKAVGPSNEQPPLGIQNLVLNIDDFYARLLAGFNRCFDFVQRGVPVRNGPFALKVFILNVYDDQRCFLGIKSHEFLLFILTRYV